MLLFELHRDVTPRVHTFTGNKKQTWRTVLTTFLFGDDFDAILDVLWEDEEIEEHFTTSVDNVSTKFVNLRKAEQRKTINSS